jgi:hypothetical protein
MNFFLTAGEDGLLNIFLFDRFCAMDEGKFDPLANVEGANFLAKDEKDRKKLKMLKEYQDEHEPVFP